MADTTRPGGFNTSDRSRPVTLNDKLSRLRSERREEYSGYEDADTPDNGDEVAFRIEEDDSNNHKKNGKKHNKKRDNKKILIGITAVLGVIVLGLLAWLLLADMGGEEQDNASAVVVTNDTTAEDPALKELQLQLAQSEFENLDREFEQLESQRNIIVEDSLKTKLTQKYESAKLEVERLRKLLKDAQDSSSKSAKEIEALNNQIKTLRELIKHYLEEIDRLNKENEELKERNKDLSSRLEETSTNLQQTQREREHLAERMTLAEKLNVTGVSLNMLNKKDKSEKKIKNAKKFVISFTIPQNNSTPVGTKTIYAVITTPEGQLLDGAGSFSFEGGNVPASARKTIDYGGEEIGGITMYYDIRNALSPGRYTVQLFCDGYALCNPQSFNFN